MNPWPEGVPRLPVALPRYRPVALLLRHAERPPIAAGDTGAELPLTARGWAQAEALGRTLGPALRRLHTSPVRRCQETAEALRLGAGASLAPIADRTLGDPGVFVRDPALAWDNWRALGHEAVLDHLAWGDSPLPGLADPTRAARSLADHLLSTMLDDANPGLHVFVTHDALLLPTLARLLPGVVDRSWWPRYLEAAAFWRAPGSCGVAYRSTFHTISKDMFV